MNWEFIRQFHRRAPDVALQRAPQVQRRYDRQRSDALFEAGLAARLFGGPDEAREWVLVPNRYPYHFSDGTAHLIMWFRTKVDFAVVRREMAGTDCAYFQNRPEARSVGSLPHVHIFVRNNGLGPPAKPRSGGPGRRSQHGRY